MIAFRYAIVKLEHYRSFWSGLRNFKCYGQLIVYEIRISAYQLTFKEDNLTKDEA